MIMNIVNNIKSFCYQTYYYLKNEFQILNNDNSPDIIVSLTSFPLRFNTLHLVIKSILNQTLKPNKIILFLAKDEINKESDLPENVLKLKKFGLIIYIMDINLKPHNKYFHSIKLFPNSIIVTVDDDNMYNKNLLNKLYASYKKYPLAISAIRVHKMSLNSNGELLPYNQWNYEYQYETKPSLALIATGVGGVLYPPGILPEDTFNSVKIQELCLNADDIWLKFMEIKHNIPVVWVKSCFIHPVTILKTQKITLQKSNFHENKNDIYINNMQNFLGVNLSNYI